MKPYGPKLRRGGGSTFCPQKEILYNVYSIGKGVRTVPFLAFGQLLMKV